MFACRTCPFSEVATSSCVFRNELTNTVGATAGITQDVGTDPTVSQFRSDNFSRGDIASGNEGSGHGSETADEDDDLMFSASVDLEALIEKFTRTY